MFPKNWIPITIISNKNEKEGDLKKETDVPDNFDWPDDEEIENKTETDKTETDKTETDKTETDKTETDKTEDQKTIESESSTNLLPENNRKKVDLNDLFGPDDIFLNDFKGIDDVKFKYRNHSAPLKETLFQLMISFFRNMIDSENNESMEKIIEEQNIELSIMILDDVDTYDLKIPFYFI
jgi:hypothetical protein